jgi:acyltransferase
MRIHWIDKARAIGILLVLFGHTHGIDPLVRIYIYSFHMPLFFFLSGYVLKEKYLSDGFGNFTLRSIRKILIPYLTFWVLSYPFFILNLVLQKKVYTQDLDVTLLKPFVGLLYGIEAGLYNNVLWFFTCLFCTHIIFYWVFRLNKKITILALIILGVLGSIIHHYIDLRLPWNFELSLVAVVFLGFGHLASKIEFKKVGVIFSVLHCIAIALMFAVLIISVNKNGYVSMSDMIFGNLSYYYFGAFSGIGLVIYLSFLIPRNKILEWISFNSIIIFSLNLLIYTSFTGIGVILFNFDPDFNEKNMMPWSFIYTIGAIMICVPTSYLIRHHFPWIIGLDRGKTVDYQKDLLLGGKEKSEIAI